MLPSGSALSGPTASVVLFTNTPPLLSLCHLVELGLAERHEADAGAKDEEPAGCVMYKAIPFEVALESAYQAQRESIEGTLSE